MNLILFLLFCNKVFECRENIVTSCKMKHAATRMSDAIALPPARLQIAITGHRENNAAFAANRDVIARALTAIFDAADRVTARQSETVATTRLMCLLAHGADLMGVDAAAMRGWPIVAPLPFGPALNIAINADPENAAEARAILAGHSTGNTALDGRAAHIRDIAANASLFALAEEDAKVTKLYLEMLEDEANSGAAQAYNIIASERVATAGRIMIEQSDILIAIWDGVTPGAVGGTRHTIAAAIKLGTPVLWIDARNPAQLHLLRAPEDIYVLDRCVAINTVAGLEALFEDILNPPCSDHFENAIRFHTEQWHPASRQRFHAYRRIEALFGGANTKERFGSIRQSYETPDAIAAGSGAGLVARAQALSPTIGPFVDAIAQEILHRFAWADGLSTYLSDAYRGGMVTNFVLSALAVICGIAYLPLVSVEAKWPFALAEFALLALIIMITFVGRRYSWHSRWFQTRRVAEYLRHAPIMLLLGVARATGRWPRGADTEWPEYYAREVLREMGLPPAVIDQAYLRGVLTGLLLPHVESQRAYHQAKAQRLSQVHHRLDRCAEFLFASAFVSVAGYLALVLLGAFSVPFADLAHRVSKAFTFLGVILPTLGGAFAGIRYFGDFERFAAISEVTAEKLAETRHRIEILNGAPEGTLRFALVADLAHAVDDIVVTEIENWQSVFGNKQIAVPV